jgi:hypothetical protein
MHAAFLVIELVLHMIFFPCGDTRCMISLKLDCYIVLSIIKGWSWNVLCGAVTCYDHHTSFSYSS